MDPTHGFIATDVTTDYSDFRTRFETIYSKTGASAAKAYMACNDSRRSCG